MFSWYYLVTGCIAIWGDWKAIELFVLWNLPVWNDGQKTMG